MTDELTYRITTLLLLIAMMAIRWRTETRSKRGGPSKIYPNNRLDTMILYTWGCAWSVSVIVYALAPGWIDWANLDLAHWLRWAGAALGLAALVLLAWSDNHLGVNFSPTLRIRPNHSLVQTGPYRWIRHPIYSSGILFFIAMLLTSSNWVVGLCWSGVLVLYAQRIPREESMMLDAFGDEYRRYMKTTGRILPKLDR